MFRSIFLGAVAMLVAISEACADQQPRWEVGFGVAGLRSPDYRGSDESRNYLLPLPYLNYHGDILRVDREGLYGRFVDTDRVRFDLSFDAGVPVDSTKNRARAGMPDLDPVIEAGPSLELCLWNRCGSDRGIQLVVPLRAVFSTNFTSFDSQGGVFSPYLNFDLKNIGPDAGARWNLGASVGPLYATERFHDYYYQVDPAYATAMRPAYDARGGYGGMRLTATVSRRFRRFWFGAFARYDDLQGAVFEDSPLVKVRRSFMAGFGMAWIFAESKDLVEVRD
jgi:outer membrane protein